MSSIQFFLCSHFGSTIDQKERETCTLTGRMFGLRYVSYFCTISLMTQAPEPLSPEEVIRQIHTILEEAGERIDTLHAEQGKVLEVYRDRLTALRIVTISKQLNAPKQ
jgi:hypothetical protein